MQPLSLAGHAVARGIDAAYRRLAAAVEHPMNTDWYILDDPVRPSELTPAERRAAVIKAYESMMKEHDPLQLVDEYLNRAGDRVTVEKCKCGHMTIIRTWPTRL